MTDLSIPQPLSPLPGFQGEESILASSPGLRSRSLRFFWKHIRLPVIAVSLWLRLEAFCFCSSSMAHADSPLSPVQHYLAQRAREFSQIPDKRIRLLDQLAERIVAQRKDGQPVRLIFICTHNSRRSHFGQVWGAAAVAFYHLDEIQTYSGGTEVTACNPRTIATFQRAGLEVASSGPSENPHYQVRYASNREPAICFSKLYHDSVNPQQGFIAVLTCSNADRSCPVVHGAAARLSITYIDPKMSDGTSEEIRCYDERSGQIAREMMYVFSRVRAMSP